MQGSFSDYLHTLHTHTKDAATQARAPRPAVRAAVSCFSISSLPHPALPLPTYLPATWHLPTCCWALNFPMTIWRGCCGQGHSISWTDVVYGGMVPPHGSLLPWTMQCSRTSTAVPSVPRPCCFLPCVLPAGLLALFSVLPFLHTDAARWRSHTLLPLPHTPGHTYWRAHTHAAHLFPFAADGAASGTLLLLRCARR